MKLEIITRLPIPRRLSREANAPHWRPTRRLLSYEQGADPIEFDNLKGLLAHGYVGWHDDASFTNYSALLIIKNSFNGWVEAEGERPIIIQPRGTLLLLNVAREHRLMVKNEENGRQGVWLAVCKDYQKKPSHTQVLRDFKKSLKEFRTPLPCSNLRSR